MLILEIQYRSNALWPEGSLYIVDYSIFLFVETQSIVGILKDLFECSLYQYK